MFPLGARIESERVQRMPAWAPVYEGNKVGEKARPLCAGVSVFNTMRAMRRDVDALNKTYIRGRALHFCSRPPLVPST
jgi:hypothetical protein